MGDPLKLCCTPAHPLPNLPHFLLYILPALVLSSCELGVEVGEAPTARDMFGQLDLATSNQSYRESRYAMINASAYPTELSDTDVINVFVNESAASTYSQVHPESEGTGVRLPLGATIIREVLRDGQLTKLTAMIKGPPGYFPEGGDYFYAVTSVDGSQILLDDQGAPLAGRLESCGTCHAARMQDDFLFGVVESEQSFH